MSVVRNEAGGLDEHAERHAKFSEVCGWDHAFDRVKVFFSETGARLVDKETKEDARRETDESLGSIKSPIFPFT